ncbi:MAG: bile acid:sodium symporter family protein [Halobacteriovoraceae bacterium]|nr:bile acid:sodium symporter family protein [Halobacteriovoraceae bacterium]MCB9095246.1 bile acid:sodium symporter family protein [Halobacteriovoraceae bacterium]
MGIDEVTLNFDPTGLKVLSFVLAIIILGIALDIELEDFYKVLKKPKGPLIGLFSQFFLLPMIATAIVFVMQPKASIALGIILLACCPGGNFSNFLTHLSGGNTALSVTMSAISTVVSIVMTPLNFTFWAKLYPPASLILKEVHIDPVQMIITIFLVLILPTIIGMAINKKYPRQAIKLRKPMRIFSIIFFMGFIVVALVVNWQYFLQYIGLAFFIVLITNALALIIGYQAARFLKLPVPDAKACSFEVGIQNAGFTLLLIYSFFNGLGGMALIAAWWGVWHFISGMSLAIYWSKKVDNKLMENTFANSQS